MLEIVAPVSVSVLHSSVFPALEHMEQVLTTRVIRHRPSGVSLAMCFVCDMKDLKTKMMAGCLHLKASST